jgi:tetrahydromethanopterin S-methyltransferase subunit F
MTTEDKIYNPDYDPQSQRFEQERKKNRTSQLILGIVAAVFFVVAVVAVISSITNNKTNREQYSLLQNENTGLTQQLTERDSVVNEWVAVFNQIENDLSEVKQKENIISLKSSDPELSKDKREEVLEDIRYINSLLAENKRRINDLSAKLKNSGLKISSMDKIIADLRSSIDERNTSIDSLKMALVDREFHMAELNVRLEDMANEIGQQRSYIERQTGELNKAYFTMGSGKELKEKGLLTKEGGFLGIGKRENIQFDNQLFKEIDILETTTIPLNADKVKLKTRHPEGSYKLIEDEQNDKVAYLEITNPNEFWRISKYAVVETN